MEKIFKLYVYPDGDQPIAHDGPCKDIYSIEGRFLHEVEHGSGRFRTNDPNMAHVYFLPFSVTWMVKYLYIPFSYDQTPLKQFVSDYVRVISTKYPFWNRTHGADHFMLACHDWVSSFPFLLLYLPSLLDWFFYFCFYMFSHGHVKYSCPIIDPIHHSEILKRKSVV